MSLCDTSFSIFFLLPLHQANPQFQCVWFISLGPEHQQPVTDWFRKQQAGSDREDSGCMLANNVSELPRLVAAPKLSPAERRWHKKQADLKARQDGTGEGGGEDGVILNRAIQEACQGRQQQRQQQKGGPSEKGSAKGRMGQSNAAGGGGRLRSARDAVAGTGDAGGWARSR